MDLTASLPASLSTNLPEAARAQTLTLFLGIGAVLLFASVVGWLLRWRLGAGHSVVSNLCARINAWWVMVAVIGIALLGGRSGVVLLFGLVSFFALREFITLTQTRRGVVLDHAVLAARLGRYGAGHYANGFCRRAGDVGHQTRPWREGLGSDD